MAMWLWHHYEQTQLSHPSLFLQPEAANITAASFANSWGKGEALQYEGETSDTSHDVQA
jgi:hypothetical protein